VLLQMAAASQQPAACSLHTIPYKLQPFAQKQALKHVGPCSPAPHLLQQRDDVLHVLNLHVRHQHQRVLVLNQQALAAAGGKHGAWRSIRKAIELVWVYACRSRGAGRDSRQHTEACASGLLQPSPHQSRSSGVSLREPPCLGRCTQVHPAAAHLLLTNWGEM